MGTPARRRARQRMAHQRHRPHGTGHRPRLSAPSTGRLTHDGDPRLASHVAHCVARSTPHGDVITKDRKHSTRKIAAVAAIVAVDRAAWHATEEPEEMGGWMIAL